MAILGSPRGFGFAFNTRHEFPPTEQTLSPVRELLFTPRIKVLLSVISDTYFAELIINCLSPLAAYIAAIL